MSNNQPSQEYFVEVFPIKEDALPKLYTYEVEISAKNPEFIARKLAYRMRLNSGGVWVWTQNLLVSDKNISPEGLTETLRKLWGDKIEYITSVRKITPTLKTNLNALAIAEFVAHGWIDQHKSVISHMLKEFQVDISSCRVTRKHIVTPWIWGDKPVISISISSEMVLKTPFMDVVKQNGESEVIGMDVKTRDGDLKGTLDRFIGELGQERERLLAFNPKISTKEYIERASSGEKVVSILAGNGQVYDYPVGLLGFLLTMGNLSFFGIQSAQLAKNLRMTPADRIQIMTKIKNNIGEELIEKSLRSTLYPSSFIEINYQKNIRVGGNKVMLFNEKNGPYNALKSNGLYRYQNLSPLRIGVVYGFESNDGTRILVENIIQELKALKITAILVAEEKCNVKTNSAIQQVVSNMTNKVDVLIAFLPESNSDYDEESPYNRFKQQVVGLGIPSQVIERATVGKQYILPNIVMGILGKTGNIPYVLAEPVEYADLFIGIDIARRKKANGRGSINAAAVTRIYQSSGDILKYGIYDVQIDGETIPKNVIELMFPFELCKNKRIVVHRDGLFRGEEIKALEGWGKEINAIFYPVEVIKSGAPRIYQVNRVRGDSLYVNPPKGTAFLFNNREGLLISSPPPFNDSTVMPLQIRTHGDLSIEKAMESVLTLTLLHYGSTRLPKLPVTTHYSDQMGALAIRGIKPQQSEGNIPYWL